MFLQITSLLLSTLTVTRCCAQQITCSYKNGRFLYTILDGPADADCDYSYYNASNHVIAHNNAKEDSLVWNNSLNGLVALKCIGHLFFEATCSKGDHYSANITVACEDFRSNEEAAQRINPVTKGNILNNSSTTSSVLNGNSKDLAVLTVLTVLTVLAVMMGCKYKKKCVACRGKIFKFLRAGPRTDPY